MTSHFFVHDIIIGVIQVNASKFKEQCLALLDNLGPEGIVITKHGKPVARVIPASADCAGLIGSMKGRIQVKGDILSTGLKWNAES
jgi:prevent-host-death family protein